VDTYKLRHTTHEKIQIIMHYIDLLKQHWLIACRSKELGKKPLACKILSIAIVLFRTKNGVAGLLDSCPHRNSPLSPGKVINDRIECPYHGWQFAENGECLKIPGLCKESHSTNRNATTIEVTEKYGFIWVKFSKSINEIYQPPFIENKNYHYFVWQTEVVGSLLNILENFLDGTHTHFVHSGLIRSEDRRQTVTASIKREGNQVEVKYTGEGKQSGIISRWFERNRKESYGRFILPSIAELEYRSDSGSELTITTYITPITNTAHKVYAVISIRQGKIPGIIKQWLITPLFKKVLKQDIYILELQHKNISRLGRENFVSTEIDFVRHHIESLLQGRAKNVNKTITIQL
jgi:phenylpropionate dioxygenase-like ring-hydroxylating dioxygenase large terminal subunit